MAVTVEIDGSDVTELCQSISRTEKLNRPWSAEIRVPSGLVTLTEGGSELTLDGGSVFAAPCYYGEDAGDADSVFSTIRAVTADELFDRRQTMDADGDYSDPTIFADEQDAVSIFAAALTNSIANDGAFGIAVGSVAGGGVPLVGYKPVDWPLSLADLRTLLVDTGQLDAVYVPGAGGTSTLDLYNGDYGTDLSGSISLDYGTGLFNCVGAKLTWDMANVITRIRYLLGPKRPQYDGDVQHWAGDVQIDDPDLPDPPQTTIESRSAAGEAIWGLLRRIVIYDSNGDENDLRDLYFRLWQADMLAHLTPRKLLTMEPEPGTVPAAGIGDLITVKAVLRTSISETQRIYERTIVQDTEGNETLSSVVTSADQET